MVLVFSECRACGDQAREARAVVLVAEAGRSEADGGAGSLGTSLGTSLGRMLWVRCGAGLSVCV